jgi:hypothetical protein
VRPSQATSRQSRIEVWRGTNLVDAWTLDGLLARALAAHPSRARFAVGGKMPRPSPSWRSDTMIGWIQVFDLDL